MRPGRSENPKKSAMSAICSSRCLTLKGGRRIPVASRKPARAEEEDMCMYLLTMFFCIVSHVILFGFPTVPPVVPRMSTLLVPRVSPPMVSYGILFPECPSSSSPNVPFSSFTLVFSGFPECPQCTLWAPPGGSPRAFPRPLWELLGAPKAKMASGLLSDASLGALPRPEK